MAKALLAPGGSTRVTLLRPHAQQQQQQQPQRQVKSVLWCSLHGPSDTQGSSCSSGSSDNGQRAPNTADETAAGIAAAAVLANLGATSGAAAAAAAAVAATPAAMSAQPAAAAQQELLLLLLDRQPQLPQQLAVSLLQQGLAGRLADRLTAKVGGAAHGGFLPRVALAQHAWHDQGLGFTE
jgi:hypothetical protein